ncbi:MAG: UDP-glucose dehydrogenase family protein [Gammaproteobacteria bacterium]
MKITIIGSGYVGLVTGACFAEVGHDVVCLDNNISKIKKLKNGKIPIYEPKLESMIVSNINDNRLSFTTSYEKAISHSDIIFIAVDTPSKSNGDADLSSVKKVSISIAEHMKTYKVIVQKSTSPVGTYSFIKKNISLTLKKSKKNISFDVVSNPEFLKEGNAISDFMKPDRIIIGIENKNLIKTFDEIYKAFNRKSSKIQYMDIKSSELTKYAANAMLATKISFINELANIADMVGADIEKVRNGIGADKRIGYEFLYPGCGYGGSCFPKDIKALNHIATKHGYDALLLNAVDNVNNNQKNILFKKIKSFFGTKLNGMTIAVWGIAFKPETDDIRYAPSIDLIKKLVSAGVSVKAYDPIATLTNDYKFDAMNYKECKTAISAIKNADALVICTEWKEFWSIDPKKLKTLLSKPIIFDGRNIYSPDLMAKYGLTYIGIGSNNVDSD